MELNAEQIKKALEWCSELRLCVDCPMRAEGYFSHSGNACRQALMKNALSLINSQEQRIKELTEERNKVSEKGAEILGRLEESYLKFEGENIRLTEENERLKAIPEQLHKEMSERMVEERKIERKLAVRKMQERLKEMMDIDDPYDSIGRATIDRVAKEMLEGKE